MAFMRRPALLARLKIAVLAALALSVTVMGGLTLWLASRDFSAMPARLADTWRAETGSELRFGKVEIRYWPQPRIVFDSVRIEHAGAGLTLDSPRAVLRIGLFDALDGTLDQPHLLLDAAEIRLRPEALRRASASPREFIELLERFSGSFTGARSLSGARVTLNGARLIVGGDVETLIEPLNARLRYRAASGRIDFTAGRPSGSEPLELTASLPTARALAGRGSQAASFRLGLAGSRVSFDGTLTRNPELALSGKLEASLQADFEQRIGFAVGRSGDGEPTRLSASFSLDARGGGMEGLMISRSGGSLTGIAALRENAGRMGISATLAGDLVDGSATHAALRRLRTAGGSWSHRELDINPSSKLDLDLRLSTRNFRLGALVLENVALSVLTRRGRMEFAIADARYAGGSLKARMTLLERANGQDMRFQLSGDRIESETLLEQAFGLSRLRGVASFVLQGESGGASVAELMANLNGSGGVEIRAGTISGVDANRLMNRLADSRPEAALLASLGGRTPFDSLSAHVTIRNGLIEPVGSNLAAPRMIGLLEGGIDLAQQRHDLAIILRRREDQPPLPSEFFAFRIEGPLFAPNLRPDPALLVRRS